MGRDFSLGGWDGTAVKFSHTLQVHCTGSVMRRNMAVAGIKFMSNFCLNPVCLE